MNWKGIYEKSENYSDFLWYIHGPFSKFYKISNPDRPRPNRPRGYWKKLAQKILAEDILPDQWVTGRERMDPRVEWVLQTKYDSSGVGYRRRFLCALSKDLGVYPPPKWYRVWRKLCGNRPASYFAHPD